MIVRCILLLIRVWSETRTSINDKEKDFNIGIRTYTVGPEIGNGPEVATGDNYAETIIVFTDWLRQWFMLPTTLMKRVIIIYSLPVGGLEFHENSNEQNAISLSNIWDRLIFKTNFIKSTSA